MSEIMEEKKLSLLGHIIRRDFEHLTYQVSFATPADATRATPLLIKKPRSKRRQGRQRLNWTLENMKNAWQTINDSEFDDIPLNLVGKPYDKDNAAMNKIIVEHARLRRAPFEGMKAKNLIHATARERQGRLNPLGQIPYRQRRQLNSYEQNYPRRWDVQQTERS